MSPVESMPASAEHVPAVGFAAFAPRGASGSPSNAHPRQDQRNGRGLPLFKAAAFSFPSPEAVVAVVAVASRKQLGRASAGEGAEKEGCGGNRKGRRRAPRALRRCWRHGFRRERITLPSSVKSSRTNGRDRTTSVTRPPVRCVSPLPHFEDPTASPHPPSNHTRSGTAKPQPPGIFFPSGAAAADQPRHRRVS